MAGRDAGDRSVTDVRHRRAYVVVADGCTFGCAAAYAALLRVCRGAGGEPGNWQIKLGICVHGLAWLSQALLAGAFGCGGCAPSAAALVSACAIDPTRILVTEFMVRQAHHERKGDSQFVPVQSGDGRVSRYCNQVASALRLALTNDPHTPNPDRAVIYRSGARNRTTATRQTFAQQTEGGSHETSGLD